MAQNKYLSLSGLEYFKDKIISIIQENELTTAAALNDLNKIKYDVSSIKNVINENIQPASAREYEIYESTYADDYYQAKSFYNTINGLRSDEVYILGGITKEQNNGILTTGTQSIAGKKIFKDGIIIGASFNDCGTGIYDFISNINFSTGINNGNTSAISYYPKYFYANCSNGSYASVGSLVLEIKNNNNFIKLNNKKYSGEIYNTNTFLENITNIQSLINNVNESIFADIDDGKVTGFCSDIPYYLGDIYNSGIYEIFKDSFSLNTDVEISGPIKLIGTDSNGILFYSKDIRENELISYYNQGNDCGQEYTKEELKERNKIYLNENIYDLIPGYIAYTDSDLENLSICAGYNKGIKLLSDTRILADLYLNESAESVQSIISGIKTTNTNQDTKISNIEQILQTFIESFGISLEGTGTLLEKLNNALSSGQTTLQDEINKHAKDASKHLPTNSLKEGSYFLNKDGSTGNISWLKGKLLPSATAQDQILVSTDSQGYIAEFKNISDVINTEPASGNYIYIYGDHGLENAEAKSGLVTTGLQSFSGPKQFLDDVYILPALGTWSNLENGDPDTPASISTLYFDSFKHNFIRSYSAFEDYSFNINTNNVLNIDAGNNINISSRGDDVSITSLGEINISGAGPDVYIRCTAGNLKLYGQEVFVNDKPISSSGSSIDESLLKLYEDPFNLNETAWSAALASSPCETNYGSFIQSPIALKKNSNGDCGILFDNGARAECVNFYNYIGLSETAMPNSTQAKSKTDTLIINSEPYNRYTREPHSKIIKKNNIYNSCKMFIPRAENITSYSYTKSNNAIPIRYEAAARSYGEDFYLDSYTDLNINSSTNYLSYYLTTSYQYYVGFKFTVPNNAVTFYNNNYKGDLQYNCCDTTTYPTSYMYLEQHSSYYYDEDLTWDDISETQDDYGLVAVAYIVSNSSYNLEQCVAYKGIHIDSLSYTGVDYKGILFYKPTTAQTYYIKCCIITGRQYIYFKKFATLIEPEYRLGFSFLAECSSCSDYSSFYYSTKTNVTTSLYINTYFTNFNVNSYPPNTLTYNFPTGLGWTSDKFTLQDNGILSFCNYTEDYISNENAELINTNIYKIDNAEFLYKPLNLTYPDTATIFNISERNLLFTNLKLNDSLRNNEVYSWFNIDQRSIYMGVNNLNAGFNYSSLKLIDSDIELLSQPNVDKLSSAFKMRSNTITQRVHRTGSYNTYSILTDTAFYLVSSSYDNGPINSTGSLYTTKVNIGSSSYRVGTVYASAALNTSDERFKEHQSDIDIDFDKLKTIPKFIFKWKDSFLKDDDDLHIGTSAQAIRDVYPEIVHVYNNDVELCAPRDIYDPDAVLAIEYDKLGVIALAAIDKLHEENVQLKEENEQLKTRLDNLEQLLKDKGII